MGIRGQGVVGVANWIEIEFAVLGFRVWVLGLGFRF